MKRRAFLKAIAAAPLLRALPVSQVTAVLPAVKPVVSAGATFTTTGFSKALWPGIAAWYAQAYKEFENE